MGHPVVVEVGAGGEAFAADLTLMRLLAGVDAPVRVQRRAGREGLSTHVARVRLLSCTQKEFIAKQCISLQLPLQSSLVFLFKNAFVVPLKLLGKK